MKISLVERGTIYTLGYAAPGATAQLERYMHRQSILLVDVRLHPISRWAYQWDKAALASRYGSYYRWEPRLGNLYYWDRERGIRLPAEHPNAITELAALVLVGTSLVLLCACRDMRTCHRTTVTKLLQDALPAPGSCWEVRV